MLEIEAASLLLRLDDGRVARLAGVTLPAATALDSAPTRAAAAAWLIRGGMSLREIAPADRHGRLQVAAVAGEGTLQASLLAEGLALAAPAAGLDDRFVRDLLAAERPAREARLGFWRDPLVGPLAPSGVHTAETRYAIMEGRLIRAATTQRFWYGNFGASLREDATVRVGSRLAAAWLRQGLDLAALAGRTVRVRGWVFEDNGPMIEINHPLALEVLG